MGEVVTGETLRQEVDISMTLSVSWDGSGKWNVDEMLDERSCETIGELGICELDPE